MKKIFKEYSDFYDLLYHDKNYSSEAKYINNLICRYSKNFKNILEFGSGTGKHARILAKMGYKVHGIELSKSMILKAQIVSGFTCQQGDIASNNLVVGGGAKEKIYDVVVSLFHVISYQITNKKLRNVFFNAASRLNKDGLFIFDFWYSPAVKSQKPTVKVKNFKNKKIEITRIATPVSVSSKNRVDINYSIYVKNLLNDRIDLIKEKHSVRHFNLLEIDAVGKTYGFKRLNAQEFKTGIRLNQNTWCACVVLKKIRP
jgi:SAM-dependent methyltransferase